MSYHIEVKIKLFAVLREMAAQDELRLALARNSSCADAILCLRSIFGFPQTILERSLVALNGACADPNTLLSEGDELALLPPVSGG